MKKRFIFIAVLLAIGLVIGGGTSKNVINKTIPFNGQWLPNVDPAKIGISNYKTLQNLRYSEVGLEGVQGYTKISTNVLPNVKINNGHQLRTDRTQKSYVVVHSEHATPGSNYSKVYQNQGVVPAQYNFGGTRDLLIFDDCGDTSTITDWAEMQDALNPADETTLIKEGSHSMNLGIDASLSGMDYGYWTNTGSLGDLSDYNHGRVSMWVYLATLAYLEPTTFCIRYDIGSDDTNRVRFHWYKSGLSVGWNLLEGDIDDPFSTLGTPVWTAIDFQRITITGLTDNANDFAAYFDSIMFYTLIPLHTDSAYNLQGRFSDAPRGNIAYANGEESCIWAGEEMDVGGFFTASDPGCARDDIALNETANPDTITTTNGNFLDYGIKAGQDITVAGADTSGNDGTYDIVSMASDGKTITLTDGDLTGDDAAGATTVTLSADVLTEYYNPIEYSEAINNELQTLGNIAIIGGGNDTYTELLLHCDGTDAGTTFTDSSDNAHTVTATNNAQLDTAQVHFGTASGLFDGTNDYLSVADDANWYMATGAFTIDFWVRFNALPDETYACFFSQHVDGTNNYSFWLKETGGLYSLEFIIEDAGDTFTLSETWSTPEVNTWYHLAVIRGWGGTANSWAITVDGTLLDTATTEADDIPDLAGAFEIGIWNSSSYDLNGWIDEFRVTKAVARWTANFTAPNRSYRKAQSKWYLFTTRPAQGFKYYVSSANTVTSTLTGYEWTGRSFSALSLTDNTGTTISMAETGTVTFSSTVDTCRPWHFEGLYLYAYLFELSAGGADIYHVAVDAPFQDIVDVWDGVYRVPIEFQLWDDSAGYFMDYTVEVNTVSDATVPIGAIINLITSSDYILAAFDDRTSAIQIDMLAGLVNTNASTIAVSYWTGSEWTAVGGLADTTTSAVALEASSQTGMLSWDPPAEGEEAKKTEFGTTGYFYKITVSATLSDLGTDDVTIDTVVGIPAQTTVKPFKFPALYKNRLMLCAYTEGKEGNRIDYSMSNAPDVWNGDESSMDGIQSLYFGGAEELTAATQLFNRFGANIFATLLVLKKNEAYLLTGDGPEDFQIFPVSFNLGCPAPLTLDTAETGFEMADEVVRNIAIWLSYSGPVIFDGAIIAPLRGVEKYFDPQDSACIDFDYIDKARGWYDPTWREYNLLIPSGSSQATCNVWLVYDLIHKKWFTKDTDTAEMPQCGFAVRDTDGTEYIYAGIDTGYMMRLENGNLWYVDGSTGDVGIEQIVETGDFLPSDDIYHLTRIRNLKLSAVTISEDQDVTVAHYADGGTGASTPALGVFALDAGSNRIGRDTWSTNLLAWMHRFKFSVTTADTEKGFRPIGWGIQYRVERDDNP